MSLRPILEGLQPSRPIVTAWSGVPDALTVEMLAYQGFDAVTLDMQHGGHHEDSVLRAIVPIQKAKKPAIVRIPVGRFDMASRALDFGADAVIAPMVNSVDDARAFAASMKYPPVGARSWGPTFGYPRYGKGTFADWLAESNARTLAFAMIETRQAVDALDGILAVPGIDAIFVGPGDFSIAWTEGKTINATLEDMMETIADICVRVRKAGKFAAIYVTDTAYAGRFASMGFQMLATGSEGQLLAKGSAGLLAEIGASLGDKS
jgi:4-hydroxy-2-oxoheptanedioate aldolase